VEAYWFWGWLKRHRVTDARTLRRALSRPAVVDGLVELAPPTVVFRREDEPSTTELIGGKGIDLTGELGCHAIGCLTKEIDGLFRHAWHYFDRISLPDQALYRVVEFRRHGNIDTLCKGLDSFVLVLHRLNKINGLELIRFDVRKPACIDHFREHAAEAGIDHAFTNTSLLAADLAKTAQISHGGEIEQDGHRHLNYQLISNAFVHYEWGSLCSEREEIPNDPIKLREAVATDVVRKYLAGISADVLAARHAHSPLGAAIPFYKRLLATRPSPTVEDVAFEIGLPVSNGASLEALVKLRKNEADAFSRLQFALRMAIAERVKSAGSRTAEAIAKEIMRDIVDPEIRKIREKLRSTRSLALRSAGVGVGLGTIAATVGLLSPVGAIGAGLTVGGAMLGAQALKKTHDDELATLREVQLSDLYFLWRAHQHRRGSNASAP
jgi:hypothetical protein